MSEHPERPAAGARTPASPPSRFPRERERGGREGGARECTVGTLVGANSREGGGRGGGGTEKETCSAMTKTREGAEGEGGGGARAGRWPGGRHRAVGYQRERLADEHDEALGADTKLARPPLEVDDLRTKGECPSSPTEGPPSCLARPPPHAHGASDSTSPSDPQDEGRGSLVGCGAWRGRGGGREHCAQLRPPAGALGADTCSVGLVWLTIMKSPEGGGAEEARGRRGGHGHRARARDVL